MSDTSPPRTRWIGPALAILPLWLLVSAGVAIWYSHFKNNESLAEEQNRYVQAVSVKLIADDLKKITTIVGERNTANETTGRNLTRAAAMIEGVLGPSNTGYQVQRIAGPADWPIIRVSLTGKGENSPALWVITSYDSRRGSIGTEANATGITTTLAAAQAMARDNPQCNIHFAFLPHANDLESPVLETAKILHQLTQPKDILLCIEATGKNNELWISSRNTQATPLSAVNGLGTIYGAEVICLGESTDLASIFFTEFGLSATRVSTRPILTPDEPDEGRANPEFVAASAGRIIELIRRCAALTSHP